MIAELIGSTKIINASPASVDGPKICQRKYEAILTIMGAVQIQWQNASESWIF